MFDFFCATDFTSRDRFAHRDLSFLKRAEYREIVAVESAKEIGRSRVVFLERSATSGNYSFANGKHFFVYGSVFTNKTYEGVKGTAPRKVSAGFLARLYAAYHDEMAVYLKGSFVVVILEEHNNRCTVITDRLNVLPLYYAFHDGAFILSSSIRSILETGLIPDLLDHEALTEQLMFDYVLDTKTIFKEIRQLGPGSVYKINISGVTHERYWSVEQLYHEKLLDSSDSLHLLGEQLRENVALYGSDTEKLLVSLTGGFDGRTNLAVLEREPSQFRCFSYGMPGSRQVEIPRKIAGRFGFEYEPVLLDAEFRHEHDHWARLAVEFSNGSAPVLRANYPYAYHKLRNYSDTILTGLFGSEILRPIYNLGIQINDHSERLFLQDNIAASIRHSLAELKARRYLRQDILKGSEAELIERVMQLYFKRFNDYDKVTRFFFFIIEEGIRKFFMQELQIERAFVTTRLPYFDDDFVALAYRTPFAGLYNGFLGRSKVKRRKGQLLYAHILQKYRPELARIELDRGYKPRDLILPFPLNYGKLYLGSRKAKAYNRRHGNDTFDPLSWTRGLIGKTVDALNGGSGLFDSGLADAFRDGSYAGDLLKYSHLIAIENYLRN